MNAKIQTMSTLGLFAALSLLATPATAEIILASDFTGVVKTGNTADNFSWNNTNGIAAPVTSLDFFDADDGTTAVSFHDVTANEIDVNQNMTDGGWVTSITLVPAGGIVTLTNLVANLRLKNASGGDNTTSSKQGQVSVALVGSLSGLLGTADLGGDQSYPDVSYTRNVDLTSFPDLSGVETYTLEISATGSGNGHHKSLQAITLQGTVASDSTAPDVFALSPTNDATSIAGDASFVATFDELIQTNSGNVILTNLTDASSITIPITDSQVSVATSNLTINPTAFLDLGDVYAILIDAGAIKDGAGNAFAGISDTNTWQFATTQPGGSVVTVQGVTGSHGGDNYANGMTSLTNGSGIIKADASDPSTWSFDGSGDDKDEWMANNLSGALNSKLAWASFDLGESISLERFYLFNCDYQSGQDGTQNYNLYYAGTPGIALPSEPAKNSWSSTGLSPQGDYDFSGSGWTKFNTSGVLTAPQEGIHTVDVSQVTARYVAVEILEDYGRDTRVGFDEVAITSVDATRPADSTFSPTNDATSVLLSANIEITFDENIVTNAGNVILTNLTASTGISIPMGDAQLSASGATLTLDPSAGLEANSLYAVLIDPGAVRDAAGNGYAGITETNTWNFSTVAGDFDAPLVLSFNPTNTSTDVLVGANLVVTFDELIQTNAGNIVITNLTDETATSIAMGNAQVSVSGDTLTINPSSELDNGDTYAVLIEAGAVEDQADTPNAFAGISDTNTWRFSTDALPTLDSLSPTNGAPAVNLNRALVATFSEPMSEGTGNIVLTNLTAGTGTVIGIGDSQVEVSGTSLTVRPSDTFSIGHTYAVLIDSGAITDGTGNAHGGISDTNTWQFTATTDANWSLVAYWPLNDGTNGATVTGASEIIDDPVYPASDGTVHGSGGTWVYDDDRGRIVFNTTESDLLEAGNMSITDDFTWQAWIKSTDGSTIMGTRDGTYFRFTPGNLNGSWISDFDFSPDANDGTWHHMVCRRRGSTITVWTDGAQLSGSTTKSGELSNTFQIAGTSRYTDFFSGRLYDVAIWKEALSEERIQQLADGLDVIMDTTPPVIAGLSPTNNATGVGVGDNLVVTFDDVIVTNVGDIVISNLTEGTSVVISVPGSDPDGLVTVSSSNLTINPTVNFDALDSYAVLMDAGTVENQYGYQFAGISDTNTWQFTIGSPDSDPPLISSLVPTNNATAVPVASNLVATFNENIALVDGGVITITNLTDGSGLAITIPDGQASALLTELTIDPSSNLAYGDQYAVLIDTNAVEDSSGNAFTGILNATTWRFTADTRPVVVGLSPNDDATGVDTRTDLTVTFDKDMVALAGGVITVTNLTDGVGETLVLQDDAPLTPGTQDDRLSISGATVTINPRSHLRAGDVYAIHIDANAFADIHGQDFLGFTDNTTWNFTTDDDQNANLVAYWPLNDGTNGQTVASTVGADDLIDDPTHDATDALETGSGNIWVYDAERESIVLRTPAGGRLDAGNTQMNMDFTWAIWAKSVGGDGGTFMGTRTDTYLRLRLTAIDGTYFNCDFADYNDNDWHHVAFTRQNNLFTVYVDGTLQASKTEPAGDNNMRLELGGTQQHQEDFDGYLSDAAIWTEALSVQRIQALAAGGSVILLPEQPTIFRFR